MYMQQAAVCVMVLKLATYSKTTQYRRSKHRPHSRIIWLDLPKWHSPVWTSFAEYLVSEMCQSWRETM